MSVHRFARTSGRNSLPERPQLHPLQLQSVGVTTLRQHVALQRTLSNDVLQLFGTWGPKPGSTTVVQGATTLLHSFLRDQSRRQHWSTLIGFPNFSPLCAQDAGVDLQYILFIPHPQTKWAYIASLALDVCSLVIVNVPDDANRLQANRLQSRARLRRHHLVCTGEASLRTFSPDATIHATSIWHGLGAGHGRLRTQHLQVTLQVKGQGNIVNQRIAVGA